MPRSTEKVLHDDLPSAIYSAVRILDAEGGALNGCMHSAHRTALVGLAALYVEARVDVDGPENLSEAEERMFNRVNKEETKYPGTLARLYKKESRFFEVAYKTQKLTRPLRRGERLLLLVKEVYYTYIKNIYDTPYRFTLHKKEG